MEQELTPKEFVNTILMAPAFHIEYDRTHDRIGLRIRNRSIGTDWEDTTYYSASFPDLGYVITQHFLGDVSDAIRARIGTRLPRGVSELTWDPYASHNSHTAYNRAKRGLPR